MNKLFFLTITTAINFVATSVFAETVEVSSVAAFNDALKTESADIVLQNDLELGAGSVEPHFTPKDVNINGNGHTIDGGENKNRFLRFLSGSTVGEIKNITFQNIVNQVLAEGEDPDDNMGGVLANYGDIQSINANFYNNVASNGGAIYNGGHIVNINGEFKGNRAEVYGDDSGSHEASGAVIFNNGWEGQVATIDNITGLFEDNTGYLHGTIWNGGGTINNINATFKNNHRSAIGSNGGTTTINSSIFYQNDTTGRTYYKKDEDGNLVASGNYGQSGAGIIYNGSAEINVNDSTFEENHADWKGGAIASTGGTGTLVVKNSKFINNTAGEEGGAIYVAGSGTAEIYDSEFTGNSGNWGGAIYVAGASNVTIDNSSFNSNAKGGVYNNGSGTVKISGSTFDSTGWAGLSNMGTGKIEISSSKVLNSQNTVGIVNTKGDVEITDTEISGNGNRGIVSKGGNISVSGGSISNNLATGENVGAAVYVSGGNAILTNVGITGNENAEAAEGGAVHSLVDITLAADGQEMVISGNNTQTNNIGVYMETADTTLHLNASNGGHLKLYDIVDGDDYNIRIGAAEAASTITVEGDVEDLAYVKFNNAVNHVKNLTFAQGGTLRLGANETLEVQSVTGDNGNLLLDADIDDENQNVTTGLINVTGDVAGHTDVILNGLSGKGFEGANSKFLSAAHDDMTTDSSFRVAAVYGSPYAWMAVRNYNGETDDEGSQWYVVLDSDTTPIIPDEPDEPDEPDVPVEPDKPDVPDTPTPDNPQRAEYYQPEIPAYIGLQRAAVEQNRRLGKNISAGLALKQNTVCMTGKCSTKNEIVPQKDVWGHIGYENAEIKAPSDMDASIKSFTAGVDLYRDVKQRAGVFASYGDGDYDFSGKGDYKSRYKSDLDIKSYIGGVYWRYDYDNWIALATVFAGKQNMDIKARASYTTASTDAMEYGVGAEVAKRLAISQHLNLEPSLGLYYTAVDIDGFTDNMNKEVDYDVLQYLEAELGLKIEYQFCHNGCLDSVYIKPSVIKTFASGNKVRITEMGGIKSYDDELLGRVEIGGQYGMTSKLSGYTVVGHTFGSDYKAYDVNVGLNYAF